MYFIFQKYFKLIVFEFSPWEKALTVNGNKTKASVPDLTEGHEYEFRVIAVNKGGPGDPSDSSEVITCKPKFREFFLFFIQNKYEQYSFIIYFNALNCVLVYISIIYKI